jgi:hypothetical protein
LVESPQVAAQRGRRKNLQILHKPQTSLQPRRRKAWKRKPNWNAHHKLTTARCTWGSE